MLRRVIGVSNLQSSSLLLSSATALATSARCAGVDLLSPISKLGQSSDLAQSIKDGRARNNKDIVATFETIENIDKVHYRSSSRPWDLVPKYAKRRVSDMCGMLNSADRMEIEQTIDKMQSICDVDMYVVIVPTVGYMSSRAFANSIFHDWAIGEPKGNGLLLVIAQQEATVHLVPSLAIEEYFDTQFLDPVVKTIFQPLIREGKASYATVQLVYAIARQAHEVRDMWKKGFLPVPYRNKVRFGVKAVNYGFTHVPYLVVGSLFMVFCTVALIQQVLDTMCPKCNSFMNRVEDLELRKKIMTSGQFLEHQNECAYYRVWKCAKCHEGTNVVLISRDLHQSSKCLQCMDCNYYTCNLTSSVEKLPTKHEDGLKKLLYECHNCRIGREIMLPLFRPMDAKPNEQWYSFLVDQSQSHKKAQVDLKL
ncbi:membrane-associated protein, putative [Bodo saltans]|uniref:Membrane-associated protein, putative n=1 Tax=Bodo saltans TaxID=75058 RepID=A0A0S4JYA2_BODSA|nr:membrane-associated protein, putative [Bodo saltans]|eukprot:CUG93575.1 membrane-associated protein, putative [Bodo saltans]